MKVNSLETEAVRGDILLLVHTENPEVMSDAC